MEEAETGGQGSEFRRDGGNLLGRSIAAGEVTRLQRLDVGLDLDPRSQLLSHRSFEPVRDRMGTAKCKIAIDLKVERYREPVTERMHGNVVDSNGAIARDHHHPLQYGLVVERAWRGMDRGFAAWKLAPKRACDPVLDGCHPVEGKRPAYRHLHVDEHGCAGGPHPNPLDSHHTRNTRRNGGDPLSDAGWSRVGERFNCAPPEPPARHADECG